MRRVIEVGEPFDIDLAFITAKGNRRWVRAIGKADREYRRVLGFFQNITERKQAEAALIEREYFLRESQRAANIGSYKCDFISGTWESSEVLDTIFGIDRNYSKTVLGWLEIVHPDDRGMMDRYLSEQVLSERLSFNKDYRIIRKSDGAVRWVSGRGELTFDAVGQLVSMIGTIQDITERKVLEGIAEQDAARLSSLLYISEYPYNSVQELLDFTLREVIALTGSKLGYIYFYDECTRLFTLNTWSKNVMKECAIVDQLTTYELDKTGIWGEAVRQRKPIIVNDFHAENPLKKGFPEGHIPLHSFLTIPVVHNDAVTAVVGVANKESAYDEADVRQLTLMMDSVWKKVEEHRICQQLQLSEDKYRQLLESIYLLALIIDTDGNILYCNNYFCMATGYTYEEAISLNMTEVLVPDNERVAVQEIYRNVIGQKTEAHTENHIITKNGDVLLIAWNRTPLLGVDGTVTGIASIGIDVTEHRKTEEQLRQAQKMEAIGLLAGGVAHDFNNILTVIVGYAQLLMMEPNLDARQKEKVKNIVASAERATQVTKGLLAFSHKQPLVLKCENLNDIVQHTHKFLSRIIGEDITLETTYCCSKLPVMCDKCQIEQVLMNLATNARDAMKNGGSFTVRSEIIVIDSSLGRYRKYEMPPGKYALLTVSDTGTGIRKEHLDHIFEPFFTTKEVDKGTGLGMAIIYGIIKQHKGFIDVYSELGHGTTFRIYLPILEATDRPTTVGESEVILPVGGHETILVAEDEPVVQALISEILTIAGYRIIPAADGDDAIEKFKQNQDRIDLILLDMIMPKKNGRKAYEEIRQIKPGIKVLFSSGYTADFIESRGVSENGIELIMKPLKPTELLKKVREILDR